MKKILITGVGNVSKGIVEVLQNMSIRKVDSNEIITQIYNEPVYSQIDCLDYYKELIVPIKIFMIFTIILQAMFLQ